MDNITITIGSTVITILSLGITIWLTNRSTQKIIRELHDTTMKNHQDAIKIMQQQHNDAMAILKEIAIIQKETHCMQKEILTIQKETHCILKKLVAANMYNAKVNGHELIQNVTREEAESIGTIFYYDEETKLAWIKTRPAA